MRFLKANYRYFFIIVGFLVFGFYVMAFIWPEYRDWKFWRDIRREAAKFEKIREDREKAIAADAYGGKTPQETLDMFIAAVEKGDYELASKYFVVERQEEQLKEMKEYEKDNVDFLLGVIKQSRKSQGYYSSDKKVFTVEKPVYIDFTLYPNNNWKINEI